MSEVFFLFSSIQFLVSSFLAFSLATLLVKMILTLFKIRRPRVRAFLRMAPFALIVFDAVLGKVKIGHWLNPLNCESCLQKVLIWFLPSDVQAQIAENHMSFAEWFAPQIPELWLKGAFFLIVAVTCAALSYQLSQLYYGRKYLKQWVQNGKGCTREVASPLLKNAVISCEILTSSEIQVPMAAQGRYILMPETFEKELSQEEFDAVIAHEFEHLRWKDPLVKLASKWIGSFFWWIPSKGWRDQLDDDLEFASDAGILAYQVDPYDLASAVIKVADRAKRGGKEFAPICQLAAKTHTSLKRLQTLCVGAQPPECSIRHCIAGTVIGSIITLSCMMI